MKKILLMFLMSIFTLSLFTFQVSANTDTYVCGTPECDIEEGIEIPDGTLLFEREYTIYYDRNGNVFTEEQLNSGEISPYTQYFKMTLYADGWKKAGKTEINLTIHDENGYAQITSFGGTATLTDFDEYNYGSDSDVTYSLRTTYASLKFEIPHVIYCGVQYYVHFDLSLYLANGTPDVGNYFTFKTPLSC